MVTPPQECPLCGKPAELAFEGQRDAILVRCALCETYTIDGRLAAHFRTARTTSQLSTLRQMDQLSIAVASTWRRGGRLNIHADSWQALAQQQQLDGEIELGDDDTARS